jgi:hypothetical protein
VHCRICANGSGGFCAKVFRSPHAILVAAERATRCDDQHHFSGSSAVLRNIWASILTTDGLAFVIKWDVSKTSEAIKTK